MDLDWIKTGPGPMRSFGLALRRLDIIYKTIEFRSQKFFMGFDGLFTGPTFCFLPLLNILLLYIIV